MSRDLSSLLGRFDLQTSVTCTPNTPSHSSGLGFANTTHTGQTGRENSRALGSMERITSDQWVLQAVSGYRLEFTSQPQQSHRPMTVQSGHKAAVISDEIGKMVEKEAIQEVKGRKTDGFFLQTVSDSQEGRSDAASVKLKATEQIYIPQAFQNGGNAKSERSAAERRLDDEDRHQRCILHDSDPPAASEISEVSVESKMLSVYVPPIRTGVCPKGFHKALEASSEVPEKQRYALCCLHRRPSFAAPGQEKAERILSNSLSSARITGIFDIPSQCSNQLKLWYSWDLQSILWKSN